MVPSFVQRMVLGSLFSVETLELDDDADALGEVVVLVVLVVLVVCSALMVVFSCLPGLI